MHPVIKFLIDFRHVLYLSSAFCYYEKNGDISTFSDYFKENFDTKNSLLIQNMIAHANDPEKRLSIIGDSCAINSLLNEIMTEQRKYFECCGMTASDVKERLDDIGFLDDDGEDDFFPSEIHFYNLVVFSKKMGVFGFLSRGLENKVSHQSIDCVPLKKAVDAILLYNKFYLHCFIYYKLNGESTDLFNSSISLIDQTTISSTIEEILAVDPDIEEQDKIIEKFFAHSIVVQDWIKATLSIDPFVFLDDADFIHHALETINFTDHHSLSQNGWGLIHIEARIGAFHLADYILKQTDCLELKTSAGQTPFLIAAEYGNEAMVDYLIQKNCNKMALDTDGSSALYLALENHHTDVAILLKKAECPFLGKKDLDHLINKILFLNEKQETRFFKYFERPSEESPPKKQPYAPSESSQENIENEQNVSFLKNPATLFGGPLSKTGFSSSSSTHPGLQ